METLIISLFLASFLLTNLAVAQEKPLLARKIYAMGVRAKVVIRELDEEHVEIALFTAKGEGGKDTVRARHIIPLFVNGNRAPIYFGKFGGATMPMLIVGLGSADRIQDSKVLAYEVTKQAGLIGQRVLTDAVEGKAYTDNTSGGRYQLAFLDTKLGAIYSISYQDARFGDFATGFEKLRLRQWEPKLDCFIEVDQGFLRDKRNQLIEAFKFHQYSDRGRQQVFLANIRKPVTAVPKQVNAAPGGSPSITKASFVK